MLAKIVNVPDEHCHKKLVFEVSDHVWQKTGFKITEDGESLEILDLEF